MRHVEIKLAETEAHALGAHAVLRENVKQVGFVTRGNVLKKQEVGELVIALVGEKVVGCICYHLRRDRVATIYEIAVSREGAGAGIGSTMITWLARELAGRARAIKLKCTADNDRANEFYARVGFQRVATVPGRRRALVIWRTELGGFLEKMGKENKNDGGSQ